MPRDDFFATAYAIGARLCRDAVWAGERCNWLGDSMEYIDNQWQVAHRSFGPDLYSGTSGIALLLARLYAITHEQVFRTTALGAVRHAFAHRSDIAPGSRVGFYSGWAGIAFVLLELGDTFQDERLIDEGIIVADEILALVPSEQGLDVTSGCAGAIPFLLQLCHERGEQTYRQAALGYGKHLVDVARRNGDEWSWDTLGTPERQDLTGFSHGTAGIGWAFVELFGDTGQDIFLDAAHRAFTYERHRFNVEHQNWPDFRGLYDATLGTGGAPAYMMAWCHGAPGIGLARLRAFEMTGDPRYRSEALTALSSTAAAITRGLEGPGDNFSLCHGLAGNAELLIYGGRLLADPQYMALAEKVGWLGIERYESPRNAWPCGVLGGGETPGLLLGLAGIAHFYLRLSEPESHSILIVSNKNYR